MYLYKAGRPPRVRGVGNTSFKSEMTWRQFCPREPGEGSHDVQVGCPAFVVGSDGPTSVSLKLLPCSVERTLDRPVFTRLRGGEWPILSRGELTEGRYALIPVTELLCGKRPHSSSYDFRRNSVDSVFIKSVKIRLTQPVPEGFELKFFVQKLRSLGYKEDCGPYVPFRVLEDEDGCPHSVLFEVLSAEDFFLPVRSIGVPMIVQYGDITEYRVEVDREQRLPRTSIWPPVEYPLYVCLNFREAESCSVRAARSAAFGGMEIVVEYYD